MTPSVGLSTYEYVYTGIGNDGVESCTITEYTYDEFGNNDGETIEIFDPDHHTSNHYERDYNK